MSTGLEAVRLRHRALPEADLEAVSLRTRLLDRTLQAPLVIRDRGSITAPPLRARRGRPGDVARRRTGDRPPLLLADLGAVADHRPRGRVARRAGGRACSTPTACRCVSTRSRRPCGPTASRRSPACSRASPRRSARVAPRPVVVTGAGLGLDFDDVTALRVGAARRRSRSAGEAGADSGGGLRDVGHADGRCARATRGRPAPGLPLIASGGIRDGVDVAKCLALARRPPRASLARGSTVDHRAAADRHLARRRPQRAGARAASTFAEDRRTRVRALTTLPRVTFLRQHAAEAGAAVALVMLARRDPDRRRRRSRAGEAPRPRRSTPEPSAAPARRPPDPPPPPRRRLLRQPGRRRARHPRHRLAGGWPGGACCARRRRTSSRAGPCCRRWSCW